MRAARTRSGLVLVVTTSASTACMPWLAPPSAHTVVPGDVELGGGIALIVAPAEPTEVVPVPQAWARIGAARRVDFGLTYAAPMTGVADARWQMIAREEQALAAGIGVGVHGFPDLEGLGESIAIPLATAYLAGEHAAPRRHYFAYARAWVPAYLESDPPAAVLWLQLGGGMTWRHGAVRQGPQLGVIVPSGGLDQGIAAVGWTVDWR